MGKYAIHTKWEWPDGVPSEDTMQGWHREFKSQTKAEDIIWFQIDENTHQSVIIFSSEEDAKSELEMRQKQREQTINETGHKMVEETMGPVLSIMSEVYIASCGCNSIFDLSLSGKIRRSCFLVIRFWQGNKGRNYFNQ